MWKKILFLTLSLVIFLFAIFQAKPVETELTKAFLDTSSPIIKLTNISSKYLDVIMESNSFEGLEDLKSELPNLNYDSSPLLNVYKNYPENFLSEQSKVANELVIYSIVNSLSELNDIHRVQISINGDTTIKYHDDISLSEPMIRKLDLVESK